MKKLLLIILLIIGCASRPKIKNINILDGEISSGSITLKTADNLEPDVAAKFLSYPIPKAIVEEWEKVK